MGRRHISRKVGDRCRNGDPGLVTLLREVRASPPAGWAPRGSHSDVGWDA